MKATARGFSRLAPLCCASLSPRLQGFCRCDQQILTLSPRRPRNLLRSTMGHHAAFREATDGAADQSAVLTVRGSANGCQPVSWRDDSFAPPNLYHHHCRRRRWRRRRGIRNFPRAWFEVARSTLMQKRLQGSEQLRFYSIVRTGSTTQALVDGERQRLISCSCRWPAERLAQAELLEIDPESPHSWLQFQRLPQPLSELSWGRQV